MIRALVAIPGGTRLIAGITREDVNVLLLGNGIAIRLDDLTTRPDDVALMFGESDHDLLEALAPLIGRDTTIDGSLREVDGGARPESEEPR